MANTFLHAQGVGVGKSLAERDLADTALAILDKAEKANCAIILPVDAVVAYHFEQNAPSQAYGLDSIPLDGMNEPRLDGFDLRDGVRGCLTRPQQSVHGELVIGVVGQLFRCRRQRRPHHPVEAGGVGQQDGTAVRARTEVVDAEAHRVGGGDPGPEDRAANPGADRAGAPHP